MAYPNINLKEQLEKAPVIYPSGPNPPVKDYPAHYDKGARVDEDGIYQIDDEVWAKRNFLMRNGEGLNATPFECEERINIVFMLGKGTGWWYSFTFQLPKWGFDTKNVENMIEVSTAFPEYYAKTIEQKEKLEQKIKAGFASLSQAVSDFELIAHDLRKYQDILVFFRDLVVAEKGLEETLKKNRVVDEEIEKAIDKVKEANHIFRAMFVDEVDVHTGEGLSLRSIAPRWPTIIADFMKMRDDYDVEGEDKLIDAIAKELKVSKAEAVILITKNKLFLNWRSSFIDTVKERYRNLRWLAETRKRSIEEYRIQIRPLLSRYKIFKDMRQEFTNTNFVDRTRWYMPGTQAVSWDTTTVWAYRAYTAPDLFKTSREIKSEVSLEEAGFRDDEIQFLKEKKGKKNCPGLPVLPIMDDVVRCALQQIQRSYPKAGMTVADVIGVAETLRNNFEYPKAPAAMGFGSVGGVRWIASPYYSFFEFWMGRGVLKLPDGVTVEDMDGNMKATMISQNILIGRLLELSAMGKQMEEEIAELLGEKIPSIKTPSLMRAVDEIMKTDFPEIYVEKKKDVKPKKEPFFDRLFKRKKKEKKPKKESAKAKVKGNVKEMRVKFADFFNKVLGFELMWMYPGHYETMMYSRIARMYQLGAGRTFTMFRTWLQATGQVPGKNKPEGIPAQ